MQRRQLLKAGLGAAAYVSLAGITATFPKRSAAAAVSFDIQAAAVEYQQPALTPPLTVPTWQFVDSANPTLPFATELRVFAGDDVTISLTNNLDSAINFVVPGILDTSPACPAGASRDYQFTAPTEPGTYLFFDTQNGLLGRAMGLSGALVVLPADGTMSFAGDALFSREHSLVMTEIDSRLNEAVASGLAYDMADYEPNYFFVNGIMYLKDVSGVMLEMSLSETVGFRLINTGLIYYPMHFHGYHVSVINRNAQPETVVRDKDTVMLKPSETVEAILDVDKTGLYPLHTHYLPGVTNNGTYAGGGLMMLNAV